MKKAWETKKGIKVLSNKDQGRKQSGHLLTLSAVVWKSTFSILACENKEIFSDQKLKILNLISIQNRCMSIGLPPSEVEMRWVWSEYHQLRPLE